MSCCILLFHTNDLRLVNETSVSRNLVSLNTLCNTHNMCMSKYISVFSKSEFNILLMCHRKYGRIYTPV
jgi:hypothetical protein